MNNPQTSKQQAADSDTLKVLLLSCNAAERLMGMGLTVLRIELRTGTPIIEIERPENPLDMFGAYNRARGCSSCQLMGSTRFDGCYVEWIEDEML